MTQKAADGMPRPGVSSGASGAGSSATSGSDASAGSDLTSGITATPKHGRRISLRVKLALGMGALFLVMMALVVVVQNALLNHAFNQEISQMSISVESKGDSVGDGGEAGKTSGKIDGETGGSEGSADTGSSADSVTNSGTDSNAMWEGKAGDGARGAPADPKSATVCSGSDCGPAGSYVVDSRDGVVKGAVIDAKDSIVRSMQYWSLAIFAVFSVLALALVWSLSGRMTARLGSVSAQAARLDGASPGARIEVTRLSARGGDEVDDLADSLNGMLSRIDQASSRQRNFARNAAHELKTPVATIGTSLESLVSQHRLSEDVEPTVHRAIAANHKSAHLIESLLTLSRVSERSVSEELDTSRVSLRECLNAILENCRGEIAKKHIVVDMSGVADVEVSTSPDYLDILLDNLIRNAVAYNVDDGRICVSTDGISAAGQDDADVGALSLTIENTTDIVPDSSSAPQLQTQLAQPFYRGSLTRMSGRPGHGLGLSIVQQIAQALGVSVVFSYPSPTAFCATIRFPDVRVSECE